MKKTLLLVALLASVIGAPSAFACSVPENWPPSATVNLESKDAAFVGTVKSIMQDKSINGDYHITFTVEETYKGSPDETVTVLARSSSAACGYDDGYGSFKKGSVWMIYADKNDSGTYQTDSVSLNTKYDSVSAAIAANKKLGLTPINDEPVMCTMQYAPVCGKSPSGEIKTYGNSCTLGADKATFLYEGECRTATPPARDMWFGVRHADVTWLQEFLIEKLAGKAAEALKAVGATGYFGSLTRSALAEFQAANGIAPAHGYFGAKTRAHLTKDQSILGETFSGKIEAVNTGCFADGICSVTISGKEVIILTGMRAGVIPPVGSLKGVDSIGDLEGKIGAAAKVYAAKTTEGGADYTLYGSTSYYVEVAK